MVLEVSLPFFFEFIRRKIDARVQRRVGPPILQPVYDFFKLLGKDVIIPNDSGPFFLVAPFLLLILNTLSVFIALHHVPYGVLLLLVLFSMDSFFRAILASSARSPFTAQGLSRLASIKMALDPALPLAFLAPAFIFGFTTPWPLTALPLFPLAFIASLAELELPPFDLPTAEWEIAGGWKAELSGSLLAAVNFAENAKAVAISALLASFFGPSLFLIKTLTVYVAMVLVSVALPRLRMGTTVRFLTAINLLAILEVIASLNMAF